ncbi:MAG: carboxylating nicotinate-nucleotide diphosphorylase [Candidatus Methylarchaceae archaeon HK02M1]|nr:carboxylating nicotinate-nucleotide diphosphorylase [Candidatus Methylarchaceae archaeon HK02M1]
MSKWVVEIDRKRLLQKVFQRGEELTLENPKYLEYLAQSMFYELQSDLGEKGDMTTRSIFGEKEREVKAVIKSKESGVVAGLEEISWFYSKFGFEMKLLKKDGDEVRRGEVLMEIYGSDKMLLEVERTGLNLLQRMSGIATETRSLVRKTGSKLMILPTRKTYGGYLDIKAVYIGGGGTHRLGLWDAILIKNNHLELLRQMGYENVIEEVIDRVCKVKNKGRFVEIEVENKEDAIKASKKFKESIKGIYIIMFDNMSPEEIKITIEEMKMKKVYDHVLLEASGGITPKNIHTYVGLGLDAVSLGYLTHSANSLDMSQEIIGAR